MNRQSRLWLIAAGIVAVTVTGVVLVFGVTFAPEFPSLYDDGGPSIEGTVAYVDYGRDECVHVLDVATGDSHEVTCAEWLSLAGWDDEGNLIIPSGPHGEPVPIDPDSGDVVGPPDYTMGEPFQGDELRARSHEGRATLIYDDDSQSRTLIEVDGPRNYGFWRHGVTPDGGWAWVVDSEDRLLVVSIDGSSGPWLVAEGIGDVAWK